MADPTSDTVSFGARDVPKDEKGRLVRGVFDSVADRYDAMNDAMSGGLHRIWKDILISRANPQPGEVLIDIAGGTGDLGFRWMKRAEGARERRGGLPPQAIVTDINFAMLEAGKKRRDAHWLDWAQADAERLPFANASADCVTVGFGVRNMTDRPAALAEMRRVLKPGGRVYCLEMSHPTFDAFQRAYDVYSDHVIPHLGKLVAGDDEPYRYFVESIRRFPDQEAFAEEIRAAGFRNVSWTNFAGGVAALHSGWAI